mgnify:CR=1 FL=1
MKRHFRLLGLAAALCLLLAAGAALADGEAMGLIDPGRITYTNQTYGLIAELDKSTPGEVTLRVDSDNTDWSKVVTGTGAQEELSVSFEVAAPDGAKYYSSGGWSTTEEEWNALPPEEKGQYANFDEYLQDKLTTPNRSIPDNNKISLDLFYGTYVQSKRQVAANALRTNVHTYAICWDMGGGTFQYERISVFASHSNPASNAMKNLRPNFAADIIPDSSQGVSADVTSTSVNYVVEEDAAVTELITRVKVPDGAYTYRWVGGGRSFFDLVNDDSHVSLSSDSAETHTDHYVLYWYRDGAATDLLGCQCLVINVKRLGSTPAVAKLTRITPLKAGWDVYAEMDPVLHQATRLEARKNGVEGWFNFAPKNSRGMMMGDLSQAHWWLRLRVPQGAKYLADSPAPRGNTLFSPVSEEELGQTLEQAVLERDDWIELEDGREWFIYDQSLVFFEAYRDDRITIYHPYPSTDEGQGEARLLTWYDREGDAIYLEGDKYAGQWYIVTGNELETIQSRPLKDKPGRHPVDCPTIVDPDTRHEQWMLESCYALQSGLDAYQVELHLLDENGEMVQPDGKKEFYLPYPDGMSYEANATWRLRHYNDDYTAYTYVDVTATEAGLRFESDSLSPFVLLWDGSESTAPKTGDGTPLYLLSGLLVVSAALLLTALRRRKRA